jgi:hypothetical protein
MKMTGLVLLAVVMLFGCAPATVWVHREYTPEKWAKDSYECERDARQSGYFGTGISGSINMQNFFNRCLESKGWMKQQQTSVRETITEQTCIYNNKRFNAGETVCMRGDLYECVKMSGLSEYATWSSKGNCP